MMMMFVLQVMLRIRRKELISEQTVNVSQNADFEILNRAYRVPQHRHNAAWEAGVSCRVDPMLV